MLAGRGARPGGSRSVSARPPPGAAGPQPPRAPAARPPRTTARTLRRSASVRLPPEQGTHAPHSPVTRAPGWPKGPRRGAARRGGGRSRRASAREDAEPAWGGRRVPGRTSGGGSDAAARGWSGGRGQGVADRVPCDASRGRARAGSEGPRDGPAAGGAEQGEEGARLPLGPPGRAVP